MLSQEAASLGKGNRAVVFCKSTDLPISYFQAAENVQLESLIYNNGVIL